MDANDRVLYAFSAAFIVVIAAVVAIPVLRRKSDVFTTWNTFLIGAIIFNGFSGFNASTQGHYLASYKPSDYLTYYLAAVLYYGTAILVYHYWRLPRRMAGRRMRSWPKLSGWVLVTVTLGLAALGLCARFPVGIPFLGQLLFQFGIAAPTLAFACAFVAWYRSPSNPLLIGLLLFIGGLTLFSMAGVGGSRRYLIGALGVVPISLYWIWLRYKSTPVILTSIAITLMIGIPVIKGYSMIRHTTRGKANVSAFQRSMDIITRLPKAILSGGSNEGFMGQDSVECALLTIHMLNDTSGRLEVSPLHATKFVLSNPIPRSVWENKPRSLGIILPEVAKLRRKGISANLGVNVVGQGLYDGGFLVVLLYGVMTAGFFRFYDELLIRQPGNPLLIGGLAFMSPQILGFPRGAIDTMGLQVVLGFLIVVVTGFVGRLVFGSGLVYDRTDHLVDFPVLRSPSDWARWMQSYTAVEAQPAQGYLDDEE